MLQLFKVTDAKYIDFGPNPDEDDDGEGNVMNDNELPTRDDFYIDWNDNFSSKINSTAVTILVEAVIERDPTLWRLMHRRHLRTKIIKHLQHHNNYTRPNQDPVIKAQNSLKHSAATRTKNVSAKNTKYGDLS